MNGVKSFCRSKFSAGSTSVKYPTGAGGEARVGVRIASYVFITARAGRITAWRYAWAKTSSPALMARPRWRMYRVNGSSRSSRAGSTGASVAWAYHSVSK